MTTCTTTKLSSTGRLMIPQRLRQRLGVQEGDTVLLEEVADGVLLLTKAEHSRPQMAEYLLQSLVKAVGATAERLGLTDEEVLAPVIEALRERTFSERYGTS